MSFVFGIQTFATTYTTQTYTTQTQTQTTATPIDTSTTTTPTVIILSDKTLVDKEHAEYWTRKIIDYNKKHFLTVDNLKIITNDEIDDFFDVLEKEAKAEATVNSGESDETITGGDGEDTPEGGDDNP